MSGLDELRELIVTLRGEGGCPWDKRQTLRSLAPYLVEEAREALEALESGSDEDSAEEIGDVLLIIMLLCRVAEEEGRFTVDDCLRLACEKIVRRHPHVFSDVKVSSEEEIIENWKKIKAIEKSARDNK